MTVKVNGVCDAGRFDISHWASLVIDVSGFMALSIPTILPRLKQGMALNVILVRLIIPLDNLGFIWHILSPFFGQTISNARAGLSRRARSMVGMHMLQNRLGCRFKVILYLFCLTTLSCRSNRYIRTYHAPPPPDIRPTVLQYVETDGFDELFETALTSQDPLVEIQTGVEQPDWGPRLNAWIAAWNQGGQVVEQPRRRVRMQAPLGALAPTVVDAGSVREFRLLIGDMLTHAEDLARRGSSWWTEERIRRHRVNLLRPYSLRFHLDENSKIQLIFFNGKYARYYREMMESMSMKAEEDEDGWSRIATCSRGKCQVLGKTAQRTRPVVDEP